MVCQRILEERSCISVCKHYELANLSICGGKLQAVRELDLRLQKEASRLKAKHKKLRREEKVDLESSKTNILLYENEISLTSSATTATQITPGPLGKENSGFKLKGMFGNSIIMGCS